MAIQGPTNISIDTISGGTTKLKYTFNKSLDENTWTSGDYYNMRYDTDSRMGNPTTTSNYITANDPPSQYTGIITGLSASTEYWVQFQYRNTVGGASAWAGSDSATTATPPPIVNSITTNNIDHDSVDITLTDSDAESFRYAWSDTNQGSGNSAESFLQANHSNTNPEVGGATNINNNTSTITNLEAGQIYYLYAKPYESANQKGLEGDVYGPTTFTTTSPGVTNIIASDIEIDSATISWSETGASSFKVLKNATELQYPENYIQYGTTVNTTTIDYTNLSAGSQWWVYIKPYTQTNLGGNAGSIVEGTFTTLFLPGDISGFTVTAIDQDSIAGNWSNGSSNSTGYDLDYSTDETNWTSILNNSNVTSGTKNGLDSNVQYWFRVRGVNSNGDGNYAYADTYTAPSIPYLYGMDGGDDNCTWLSIVYSNTDRIYIYDSSGIQLTDGSATYWTITNSNDMQNFSVSADEIFYQGAPFAINNGITDNESIGAIKMKAYSNDSSAKSNYSSAVTGYSLPTAPPSITAEAESDSITMEWENPAGGALSETYRVYWGTSTSYGDTVDVVDQLYTTINTVDGTPLIQSTTYYFKIKTITTAGISTNEITITKATEEGPDPVVGDDLKLSILGDALNVQDSVGSEISLGQIKTAFSLDGDVSLKDFYVGNLKQIEPSETQYIPTDTTRQFSLSFNNKGKHFTDTIGTIASSFTWTTEDADGSDVLSLPAASLQKINVTVTGENAGEADIKCEFDDGFNNHSGIQGSSKTKYGVIVVQGA